MDSTFSLKLGDFSSSIFNSPALDDGVALGTTNYAPPELVKPPPSPFSFPVDVFAAGLTLLFMLTGVEPYESLLQGRKDHSISRGSRRKIRTSSGAGRTMELHLHLSKGNAWSFEEARRLEELEELEAREGIVSAMDGDYSQIPTMHAADIHTLSEDFQALPRRIHVPPSLQDPHEDKFDICRDVYQDGTPIQVFLSHRQVVSAETRLLIRSMISPDPDNRPTAAEAFVELEKQYFTL
jgi:serine/threonine protein kinase